jgi:hypothetical protein
MAELSDDRVYGDNMTMKGVPASKPQKILPKAVDITYEAVRAQLIKYAEQHGGRYWLSTNRIIDLMNGWDGVDTYNSKSLERARKKLQQASGWDRHEKPTSAQATALRERLDKLVEEKLVEKARGHTDGNNSWGYRWITDGLKAQQATRQDNGTKAKDIARRLSLALGGDGESGVKPFLTPDDGIGIRVNLYGATAERLLEAIKASGLSPDFFTGKHWEILATRDGAVQGCTADREDAREEGTMFRAVEIEECRSCRGENV